jgi:hypothetical protein
MEVDMRDLLEFTLSIAVEHHSQYARKGPWDINFYRADERYGLKTDLTGISGRKGSVEIGCHGENHRDHITWCEPVGLQKSEK